MVSISFIGQQRSKRPVIGLYCLIFALYWQIRLGRASPSLWKGVLLYALTANFILCTAYLIVNMIQVQFFITVSHIQVVQHHFSEIIAPNMSSVQLTFESLDGRAERRFVGTAYALAEHRSWCTIYRHRLDFTINIGKCASLTILSRLTSFSPSK